MDVLDPTLVMIGAVATLLGGLTYSVKKMADKGVVCKCKIGICPNSCMECACDSNEKNDEDFFVDATEDLDDRPRSASV